MRSFLLACKRPLLMAAGAMLVTTFLAACGASMPLSAKTQQLDLNHESIALFTFQQTREGTRTMPWPRHLFVRNLADGKSQMVAVDTTFMDYGEDSRTYLTPLRLALAPGKYRLESLSGTISAFPLQGTFLVPLGMEFEMPARAVAYLGRVHAHMRDRKDGDTAAGSIIPLISQAALGITSSTFDVQVVDAAHTDIPKFREDFPILVQADIAKRVLAAAQVPAAPVARAQLASEPARQEQ